MRAKCEATGRPKRSDPSRSEPRRPPRSSRRRPGRLVVGAGHEVPPHRDRLAEGSATEQQEPGPAGGRDGDRVAADGEVRDRVGDHRPGPRRRPHRPPPGWRARGSGRPGARLSFPRRRWQADVGPHQRRVGPGGGAGAAERADEHRAEAGAELGLGQLGVVLEGGVAVAGRVRLRHPQLHAVRRRPDGSSASPRRGRRRVRRSSG